MRDCKKTALGLAKDVPTADSLTPYDEAHLAVYLALLHASAEGIGEPEMSREILGIDPVKEPARARKALRSHLARAQWLAESGYRHLLES